MLRRTRVFGLILVASLLLAACEQFGWQRIPAAEEPVPLPRIEWVAPAIGSALSGSVTLRVQAVGDAEFISVNFKINNIEVGSSTTGVLTLNSDLLQLAPGVVEASATAINSEGDTFTSNRFFVVMDSDKPMVSWSAPAVLRDYAPFEPVDMIVDVADLSGTIASLVFMVDGNIVEIRTNLTGVDTVTRETFRWTPGFWVSLNRNVTLRVIATNAEGGVTEATREIVSIPPRLVILDTEKPDVWWQQSTVWNDMAVARTVELRALAEDNVQVAFFDFYINGALRERKLASSVNTTLPRRYADFVWNTLEQTAGTDGLSDTDMQRLYPDGMYTVSVEAVDTSGNRSVTASVTVRVANDDKVAPTAAWYYNGGLLYSGKVLTGTAPLTFLGNDNVAVAQFEVHVGGAIQTVSASTTDVDVYSFSYVWNWDTTEVNNGPHTLGLVAIDQAGNRSPKVEVTVIVVNNLFEVRSDFSTYVGPSTAVGTLSTSDGFTTPRSGTDSIRSVSVSDVLVSRTDRGRYTPVELHIAPIGIGTPPVLPVYLHICEARLTTILASNPQRLVSHINDASGENVGLFVDPTSPGDFWTFPWTTQHQVRQYQSATDLNLDTAVVVNAAGYATYGNHYSGTTFTGTVYTHSDVTFGALLKVASTVDDCANPSFYSYINANPVTVQGGTFFFSTNDQNNSQPKNSSSGGASPTGF
jgi:hypothetical protein